MSHICGNHDNIIIQTKACNPSLSLEVSMNDKKVHTCCPAQEEMTWRIWDQLNKNRELEITTQWQRSIFLSTFIILLLTGSGIFFKSYVLEKELQYIYLKNCLTGMVLGVFLIFAGLLWVVMTKGSKYWHEIYEKKIDLIENLLNFSGEYAQFRYQEEQYLGKEIVKATDGTEYIPGLNLVSKTSHQKFWNLKAARYSPSKINIAIGWLVIGIGVGYWLFFIVVYFTCQYPLFSLNPLKKDTTGLLLAVVLILLPFAGVWLPLLMSKKLKNTDC